MALHNKKSAEETPGWQRHLPGDTATENRSGGPVVGVAVNLLYFLYKLDRSEPTSGSKH